MAQAGCYPQELMPEKILLHQRSSEFSPDLSARSGLPIAAGDLSGGSRFLRACLRQPVDRTPVWFLRQAGRYMPEYQAVRRHHSLLEICKNPALAAEVTITAAEKLDGVRSKGRENLLITASLYRNSSVGSKKPFFWNSTSPVTGSSMLRSSTRS